MNSLLKNTKIVRVMSGVSAGTGDTQSGSIIDRAGYEGILFIALLGDNADTAVVTLQAQHNTANATEGMATLTGTSGDTLNATSGDNKMVLLDIFRDTERYVRPQIVRATANVVINGIVAILYNGRNVPTAIDATVLRATQLVSPENA